MQPIKQPRNSRAIFWNVWGHRHPNGLHKFLQAFAPQTDIFLLTEVTDISVLDQRDLSTMLCHGKNSNEAPSSVNGLTQLQTALRETHEAVYGSSKRADWVCEKTGQLFLEVGFGSCLLHHRDLSVIKIGHNLLCDDIEGIRPRLLQWIVYEKANIRYLVAHFHGVWIEENTKGDHPARTLQSEQFLEILAQLVVEHTVEKIVFGGDFNLDIKTDALQLLHDYPQNAQGPFRNLISEFRVTDTRTTEYRKHGWPGESLYADYAFVGANVSVEQFAVLNQVLASDHAPLVVDFI